MVRAYDTLSLADLHSAVAYYLSHRAEVQAYLTQRAKEAETLKDRIESERRRVTRSALLERRTAQETQNAATRQ